MLLLKDLCATLPGTTEHQTGRNAVPLADICYAMVLRAYVRLSARRFTSDLLDAQGAGLIGTVPSYNTLLRYGMSEEVSNALALLLATSSVPLSQVESCFAVDSSGFSTCQQRTWLSETHGRVLQSRQWRKCHIVTGTTTNVVAAAQITGPTTHDSPILPALVADASQRFVLEEVSADKGYLSQANAEAIEALGAQPFIAFKTDTNAPPADGTAWSRMYHLYAYNRNTYMDHYHRRSNVESTFAMIKAKFGDRLSSKSPTGQDNEIMARLVAHNLCVLVQSMYELGVEPAF